MLNPLTPRLSWVAPAKLSSGRESIAPADPFVVGRVTAVIEQVWSLASVLNEQPSSVTLKMPAFGPVIDALPKVIGSVPDPVSVTVFGADVSYIGTEPKSKYGQEAVVSRGSKPVSDANHLRPPAVEFSARDTCAVCSPSAVAFGVMLSLQVSP
ncbi:hypothetical protein GCM10027610_115870 [Dactylosporangium cerinum]